MEKRVLVYLVSTPFFLVLFGIVYDNQATNEDNDAELWTTEKPSDQDPGKKKKSFLLLGQFHPLG